MGSTRTTSRSGQLGALATVALWCSSFALIKHRVDAGLGAQNVAIGRFLVAWPGFIYLLWRAGGLPGLTRGEALRILVASAGGVTAYYLYCVPPLAVAIGAVFPDEPLTLWLLLGGALVIGGVAVAQRGPARKAGIPPNACIEGADGQRCRT